MNHFASPEFWQAYEKLPKTIRDLADRNFARLTVDSHHPSLHFKQAGRFWSVRVGLHFRALGVRDGDDLVWFWIGSHAEYDRLLR